MISASIALAWLNLDNSQASVIQRLIDEATSLLSRELNRYVGEPKDITELKCGGYPPGAQTLVLDEDPVPGEPVVVSTRSGFVQPWVVVDPSQYELSDRLLSHASHWAPGRGTTKVDYTAGFEVDTGPEELQGVVLALVTNKWKARANETEGFQSETIGDYSYTMGNLSSIDNWSGPGGILARWRRREV